MALSASPLRPVFALLVNAFVYGTCWYPFRHLDQAGLHALWATALVYTILTIATAGFAPGSVRALFTGRRYLLLALVAGLTNSCFNWALVVGDVVRVVLLFYLMPVWAALAARWLLREPITIEVVMRSGCALAGAMLVLYEPGIGLPVPGSAGDWLGLAGGMFFALNNVMLRQYAGDNERTQTLALFAGGMVIPGLLAIALSVLMSIDWPSGPGAWGATFAGLTIAFAVANIGLVYGAPRLPASVTATVLLSEVLFAALSAYWLADEAIDAQTWIGGLLILSAAMMGAVRSGSVKP